MGEAAHPEGEPTGRAPTPWAGPDHGAWDHPAPLPPPALGAARPWPGFDPTSERFAAPSSARLRHLPPPRVVADAVPLELDELEQVTRAARRRPPTSRPRHLTAAAPLDASEPAAPAPAPVSAAPAAADDGRPTTVPDDRPLKDPVPALAPEPTVAADSAPPPEPSPATTAADGRDGARWRPSILASSVAVFAVVSLLTAVWAHQRRNDDTAPVAASVTAGVATTASPAPTTDPTATSDAPSAATTTPPPTVPATIAPATTEPTVPATTVPAPTSVAPASSTPATTTPEVAPTAATTTPASVLGTSVLNRELLDALGKGVLPTGQPWPRATFNNGKLVLTGAVPTAEAAAATVAAAGALATPDLVVNELVTDPSAAPARYLLVRLFDMPVFDRGSTTLRKDSDVLIELWGKRLRDQPSATLVLVAHGDGTGTALAAARSKSALARVLATGGVAPEQVEAQWSAGAATGPRLDFAVPVA